MSSFRQEDLELLCNVDPSVATLLRPLSEDASTHEVSVRNALIKLQQATLRGNSTYASKLLEMALQDVQRDKRLHEMLSARLRELEQRDTYYGSNGTTDDDASPNATTPTQPNQVDDDGDHDAAGDDNREDSLDPAQVERLKEEVKRETDRANFLQEKLESSLRQEIQHIKDEQESIRDRQVSLRNRIQTLQTSIHDLPEHRASRLQDDLGEVLGCQADTLSAAAYTPCTVCRDSDAVRAVIPCGHLCLCDECTDSLATSPTKSMRQCPLCRGNLLSTLKIYTTM